jgi:hypothetical protein
MVPMGRVGPQQEIKDLLKNNICFKKIQIYIAGV